MKQIEKGDDLSLEKGINALYFTASWCGPCKALAPLMENVSGKYPAVGFNKIDVDANQEIANKWGIRSIPTVIFVKDGEEVEKFVGLRTESQISEIVEKISAV